MRSELKSYLPLLPLAAGLAMGRSGSIAASYGSYARTDEGMFSDETMMAMLAVLLVVFAFVASRKHAFRQRTADRVMFACVAVEGAVLVVLAGLDVLNLFPQEIAVRFVLCTLCNLAAAGAIFYWLRCMRTAGSALAVTFAFTALILSEIELYLCALVPAFLAKFIAAALVLCQVPCLLRARRVVVPIAPTADFARGHGDYFGIAKTMLSSKKFLAITAVGIGLLSLVVGFLRGYPDGDPIGFTPLTRALYTVLTIALGAGIIVLALRKVRHATTTGLFVIMQSLACLALLCYAAFPGALEWGAVFAMALNAVMMAFTWYIIIAFSKVGWRDPYYYAIAAQFVYLGSRSVARVLLLSLPGLAGNPLLVCAVAGALVIASTQVVFTQFLGIARRQQHPDGFSSANLGAAVGASLSAHAGSAGISGASGALGASDGAHVGDATVPGPCAACSQAAASAGNTMLMRIMGLDEAGSMADMRQAAMESSIKELGDQFLLSEREVEVLTLYTQGFTQKRVAEELFISQGTVHAHIKRVYAKTGLHSRQEIIDYLKQYTS